MGATAVNIEIRYYGALAEAVGRSTESRQVSADTPIQDLIARLKRRHPKTASLAVTAARNNKFVSPDTAVSEGDRIDLFPPFAGG